MRKFYCTNCMRILEESQSCKWCGNCDIKVIEITIQTNHKKDK